MKKSLFGLSIGFVLLFCQCKKDTTITAPIPPTVYPITGLWIGSQFSVVNSVSDTLYYSFTIEADHSLQVVGSGADGNTYYAAGNWTLSGTAFSAIITVSNLSQAGIQQSLAGNYDSTQGTLKAGVVHTIGFNYPDNYFSMNRVN